MIPAVPFDLSDVLLSARVVASWQRVAMLLAPWLEANQYEAQEEYAVLDGAGTLRIAIDILDADGEPFLTYLARVPDGEWGLLGRKRATS